MPGFKILEMFFHLMDSKWDEWEDEWVGFFGLNVEDYRLYNNGMKRKSEADGNDGGRKLHHTSIPVSIYSLSQCYDDDDDDLYSAHVQILIPFNDTSTLCISTQSHT